MKTRTINIRKGTFETNSSSTHSICIASGECKDLLPIIKDEYIDEIDEYVEEAIVVYGGEFGWEVESYWDAGTKASYCITWIENYAGLGEAGNPTEKQKEKYRKMLKEVIQEFTGAKRVIFLADSSRHYIDHQSADVCDKAFQSKDNLKQFIFNENSLLHTDNDNY